MSKAGDTILLLPLTPAVELGLSITNLPLAEISQWRLGYMKVAMCSLSDVVNCGVLHLPLRTVVHELPLLLDICLHHPGLLT